jgi:prolyl-tRNA editing enzyme YbaK/EbsC (Cys-tRNA(Pro) deacylase)
MGGVLARNAPGSGEPAGARLTPEIDEAVRAALDRLGTPYEVLPCDPDFADTALFCERYGISPKETGNTIVVASKTYPKRYAACLILATTKLDANHTVARLLEVKRLSFATAEETSALTGMMVGGVTVFGLPEGIPVYIDARIPVLTSIVLGGGRRSCKIRIAPEALRRLPNVSVVEGLALDRGA